MHIETDTLVGPFVPLPAPPPLPPLPDGINHTVCEETHDHWVTLGRVPITILNDRGSESGASATVGEQGGVLRPRRLSPWEALSERT